MVCTPECTRGTSTPTRPTKPRFVHSALSCSDAKPNPSKRRVSRPLLRPVSPSMRSTKNRASHWPTPRSRGQTAARIDSAYSGFAVCAKVWVTSATHAPHKSRHHRVHSSLRLIFCEPTPRPHAETVTFLFLPDSLLVPGQKIRASNDIRVPRYSDRRAEPAHHCAPSVRPTKL